MKVSPDPRGPAVARERALGYLAEHGLAASATDVSLIVSELVTNAVLHGAPPIELSLSLSGRRLKIEVTDGSSDASVVTAHPPSPVRARGLHIVEQLATTWGTTAHRDGKVVWAEYQLNNA